MRVSSAGPLRAQRGDQPVAVAHYKIIVKIRSFELVEFRAAENVKACGVGGLPSGIRSSASASRRPSKLKRSFWLVPKQILSPARRLHLPADATPIETAPYARQSEHSFNCPFAHVPSLIFLIHKPRARGHQRPRKIPPRDIVPRGRRLLAVSGATAAGCSLHGRSSDCGKPSRPTPASARSVALASDRHHHDPHPRGHWRRRREQQGRRQRTALPQLLPHLDWLLARSHRPGPRGPSWRA